MRKRINQILNCIIGCFVGFFAGYSVYAFYHYKTHPSLYAMQSAPWYTGIVLYGAVTAAIVAAALIVKLILRILDRK